MGEYKVKVVKTTGDFEKALHQGFAVNTYDCTTDEMWLISPSKQTMEILLDRYKWNTLSDIMERT